MNITNAVASPPESPSSVLAGLVDELAARAQAGEAIDLEAVLRNYPEHAQELRRLWTALGALHEVAGGGNGAIDGAAAALFVGGVAARTRGKVLWCLTRADLFAPALAQAGLAPDRVIYLEAGDERTVLACMEEGLRHGGLGAAVAEIARLSMSASRRLQLAAEGAATLGIALRRWRPGRGGPEGGEGAVRRRLLAAKSHRNQRQTDY